MLQPWLQDTNTRGATIFLLVMLAIDLAFVFLYFLVFLTDMTNNPLFSLETDRGYPEIYQYIKAFSIVVLLGSVLLRTRVIGYSAWCLLFLYLLLDDALGIHESVGNYIAVNMAFAPAIGLRARDFGELAVSAIAATLFLIPLALFYVRGPGAFKRASEHLLLLLVALAFFGVLVDLLHVAVKLGWKVTFLLGVVEDGGEMVVMSIMAAYVFLLYGRDGNIGAMPQPAKIRPPDKPR